MTRQKKLIYTLILLMCVICVSLIALTLTLASKKSSVSSPINVEYNAPKGPTVNVDGKKVQINENSTVQDLMELYELEGKHLVGFYTTDEIAQTASVNQTNINTTTTATSITEPPAGRWVEELVENMNLTPYYLDSTVNGFIKYDGSNYYVDVEGGTITETVVIPDKYNDGTNGLGDVTYIKDGTSSNNFADKSTTLTTVYMGNNITKIGGSSFTNCTNLAKVTMPNVTFIRNDAFFYCSNLENVNLSKTTIIQPYAFGRCVKLTDVDLSKVTTLGKYSFYKCSGLTNINLAQVTSIPELTFGDCTGLITVSLPKVTNIGVSAFKGCTSLTSVSIPNATIIEDSAFSGCTRLNSVSMDKIETIAEKAFENTALTTISFPTTLTFIGLGAFNGCDVSGLAYFDNSSNWCAVRWETEKSDWQKVAEIEIETALVNWDNLTNSSNTYSNVNYAWSTEYIY